MKIGDRVEITELDCKGKIVATYENFHGLQYDVRYFINGEAKTVYFFPDELKEVKEGKK